MSGARVTGRSRLLFWSFIILMLGLTGLFVALGNWQMQRLAEKDALIASVAERAELAPSPVPHPSEWDAVAPDYFNYRPITLTGTYRHDQTVLVFTSLPTGEARYGGPGYWVMTPLLSDRGGVVFVNRGFVPEQMRAQFAEGGAGPEGIVTLTGVGRSSEAASSFTPGPDRQRGIEWVRDTGRLLAMTDLDGEPVASFYLDLPPGPRGALPQGSVSAPSFSNNHLGYAITWYGFAAITPLLLLGWIWRQTRRPAGGRRPRTSSGGSPS
ncbi:surfeit locus 1 family protein [Devosia enhydra]|uniref:SURF1-like protein n=1 Tax=Devosia enhydra TaxID=665118 RepID=A0A1K2I1I0_9HYPH|nr:SURF1 family protein [Devosia enhydra]SFZ86119.1 surfeit locus 1 family protein [Devosia enhydra]